jgi:hypothetical protein
MTDAQCADQITRINEMWRARVEEALQDQELRKWCIEQSLSCELAAEIYKFVTAPLAELLVRECPPN